ncbi:MAG: GLPGLI family protein [Sphingobacteriales bacterium]|nr:MAG: GLPGLI family protein [Sphingobacteriales bacterium]
MKKLIIATIVLCSAFAAKAQVTSGTVSYKETIKLDIALEGEMAQFAEMLPKEHSFKKIMYFSPEASLYVVDKKATEDKVKTEGNGIAAMISANVPEEKYYRDLKNNTSTTQRDFMSRKFLVTSDAKSKQSWKMTGKQKQILGYPCQQAIMQKDSQQIVAWFTPAIPVATGPGELSGLPGLILEATIDKMYIIEAVAVTPGAVDKKLFVKPTEGKKMTNEQFEAMMKEKTKEMEAQFGGGGNGNVIIRVNERH